MTVTSPASGTTVGTGWTITFDFAADDGQGAGAEVLHATFGDLVVESGMTIPAAALAPGTYALTTTAVDALGNEHTDRSTELTVDPAAVSLDDPTSGGGIGVDLGPNVSVGTPDLGAVNPLVSDTGGSGSSPLVWVLIVVLLAAAGAGGYVLFTRRRAR